jgi:hypothetical protein
MTTLVQMNIHVEFCNTVLLQKSMVVMGLKLYNKVPESITKLDNFKLFKKELKSLQLSHSFIHAMSFYSFQKS